MAAPSPATEAGDGRREAAALWPLVVVLGEIAERIERRRDEEHVLSSPNRGAAGGEPVGHDEAA